MKRVYLPILLSITFLTSCASINNPFAKRETIEIKEGYLSLKNINTNLAKQMPLIQKVGKNKIKIVSATTFAGKDGKSLITEIEFIFTSFEIPEGLPSIARVKSSLTYDLKTKEFKLDNISEPQVKFLKESLVEYINPKQKKFISDTIVLKLYDLILHKSKKELRAMKGFIVKEGKIKIIFK